MSQFETIMLAVFAIALLILGILLIAHGVWSFGARKKTRRRGKAEPKTTSEIQAERDRLRAEYAVMARKQEIQIKDLKTKLTEHRAEVSRGRNKINELAALLDERAEEVELRSQEVAGFRETVTPLEAELETRTTTLHKLKEELRQKTDELERLTHENAAYKRREAKKDVAISRFEQMVAEGTRSSTVASQILGNNPENDPEEDIAPANDLEPTAKIPAGRKIFARKNAAKKKSSSPARTAKTNKLTAAIKASKNAEQEQRTTPAEVSENAAPSANKKVLAKRAQRRKVLSLAKRIRTLQEEVEN